MLAYFTGGYDNPWTIPSDKFNPVLQEIWNVVYARKIKHTVIVGGPVFHIICLAVQTLPYTDNFTRLNRGSTLGAAGLQPPPLP